MNKHLSRAAFCIGLAAIAWVGAGSLRANPLALAVTGLIGAFYLAGALELRRFHQATTGLARALGELTEAPAELAPWLARVPAALRDAVRMRIEGERAALPGPVLTPYLSGLLVLLGMLGTFLGMVVTLGGTGAALERATDLQTLRDSLAAPVKGLGLAFGTSVAGVAASAMLGLMSALCRRERLQAAQALDACIGSTLHLFTRAFQRQESLRLQQQQAALMPALVERLQGLVAQLDAQSRQSNEQLLAGQDRFHDRAEAVYRQLASSVDESLRQSVAEGTRAAAAAIPPIVEATMGRIAGETVALQRHVAGSVQQQLDGLARVFEQRSAALMAALAESQQALNERIAGTVSTQAAALLGEFAQAQARLQSELAARDEERLAAWAAAPRAAADVVAQLREKLSDSIARDNAMLQERSRIIATLETLLDAVQHTATEQKTAIDGLLASSATWLEQAGARFTEKLDAESARSEAVAAQLTSSAVEVASLGEGFGLAVELFSRSSEKLTAQLQGVEQALGRSLARSDEQLAYYVAQAREVIDLSLMSQKKIVDDLQRLAGSRAAAAVEA